MVVAIIVVTITMHMVVTAARIFSGVPQQLDAGASGAGARGAGGAPKVLKLNKHDPHMMTCCGSSFTIILR